MALQGRRLFLSIALPVAFVFIAFNQWVIPGFMRHFFYDKVLFFGVTYWLGLLFSNMYFTMTGEMQKEGARPGTIAIASGVTAIVMLMAAGGPSAVWNTPWLVGIGVMPGIDIAWPATKEWWTARQASKAPALASSTSQSPTNESLVEPTAEEPA